MSELQILFDGLQEQIKAQGESQEKALRHGLKGVRIYVQSEGKVLQNAFEELKKQNVDQNKRLNGVEEKCGAHDKLIAPAVKHWGKILIAVVLLMLGVVWIYNKVDIKRTVSKKFDIEFKNTIQ